MEKFNLKKAILENKATFLSSLVEGEKEYYKDAEADDAEHIDALEKDMKDDKKSSKMKMSELKAKIKEMALSEMNLDINDETPESEEDFLAEVDAILAEADEEVAVDDTEVSVGGEENMDVDTTVEVDPNVKAVQDSLTQAQAAAQKLGDPKLTDQIGNTITFFTRAHVVEKGAVAEDLNENTSLSPVNLTKQNFDKIENSPLSKEYDGMFSILDNLISKYPEFKKKDIYDYFKLLAIDKYFNSGYLDRMWRKGAVAENIKETLLLQKRAGIITETQYKQKLNEISEFENLEQDILDFWGVQQDDAAQSDGEYEAKWDNKFFIDEYPEHKGKEQEINSIVKKYKI